MNIKLHSILLFLILFILTACLNHGYDKEFPKIYLEMRLASEQYGLLSPNAQKARFDILKHYQYKVEDYERQIRILKDNPDIWEKFQNDLMKVIQAKRAELNKGKPALQNVNTKKSTRYVPLTGALPK